MEISWSGQVGCLSGRVSSLYSTLSGKNRQPLQAATVSSNPHLAREISLTTHRAQSPENDPVVRFRLLHAGYGPLLDGQGRYLTNNRQKMFNQDRCSNNQHIHTRFYPRGIQRMAHEDGRLASWSTFELQNMGYRFWRMVSGSLDFACHTKDLSGNCTIPLNPGEPGAATGSSADHILVGVVVTYTESGLSHFFSA